MSKFNKILLFLPCRTMKGYSKYDYRNNIISITYTNLKQNYYEYI